VQLSLGQFNKVLEMLYGMRQLNRAACFSEACTQFGLLDTSDETGKIFFLLNLILQAKPF
jgi:hypothetical protein